MLGGFSQEKSALLTDSADVVKRTYVGANVSRVLAGGYVESLAFVVLLPVLVFLARAIGQRTEVGRWRRRRVGGRGLLRRDHSGAGMPVYLAVAVAVVVSLAKPGHLVGRFALIGTAALVADRAIGSMVIGKVGRAAQVQWLAPTSSRRRWTTAPTGFITRLVTGSGRGGSGLSRAQVNFTQVQGNASRVSWRPPGSIRASAVRGPCAWRPGRTETGRQYGIRAL
jgi:hypothetical protein